MWRKSGGGKVLKVWANYNRTQVICRICEKACKQSCSLACDPSVYSVSTLSNWEISVNEKQMKGKFVMKAGEESNTATFGKWVHWPAILCNLGAEPFWTDTGHWRAARTTRQNKRATTLFGSRGNSCSIQLGATQLLSSSPKTLSESCLDLLNDGSV